MDLKQQILHYYRVDELSLREIAHRTGADRKTVTRLVNDFEAAIRRSRMDSMPSSTSHVHTTTPRSVAQTKTQTG